jgi:hypothetical protein
MFHIEDALRTIVREELRAVMLEAKPATPAPAGDLMTLEDAASHGKVSKATLHRWLRAEGGRPPLLTRHGKGRLTRVERTQLDAVLRAGPKMQDVDPVALGTALARGAA